MFTIYLIIGLFVFVGVLLLIGGVRRLWRRAPLTGSLQGLTGLLLLALAVLMIAIAMNLYTYQILVQEQPVAEVRFEALAPQYFRVYLLPEAGSPQVLELRGDQWQIDARVLKWQGLANLLGMKTAYRLERLSGRYSDIQQERKAQPIVCRTTRASTCGRGCKRLSANCRGWMPSMAVPPICRWWTRGAFGSRSQIAAWWCVLITPLRNKPSMHGNNSLRG
jgi:hypothetical protein